MLCRACGTWVEDNGIVCPNCGQLMPRGENTDTGLQAMRQGKRARMAAAAQEKVPISQSRQGARRASRSEMYQSSRPDEIRVYGDADIFDGNGQPMGQEEGGIERTGRRPEISVNDVAYHRQDVDTKRHKSRRKTYEVHKRMVNWMAVTLLAVALVILLAVGFVLYLRNTDNGQKLLARWGRDASSAALWEVGNEKYDVGDISGAIELFEQALAKDEESGELNVTWMLTLGEAYESAGMYDEAEELYVRVYTDIVPSSRDAYASEIRILLATDRAPEAA